MPRNAEVIEYVKSSFSSDPPEPQSQRGSAANINLIKVIQDVEILRQCLVAWSRCQPTNCLAEVSVSGLNIRLP